MFKNININFWWAEKQYSPIRSENWKTLKDTMRGTGILLGVALKEIQRSHLILNNDQ